MFRQLQHTEAISIPTTALVSTTAQHMNRILQAFLHRKRLYQYHEKLHGVVVNATVDCFGSCTHSRHVWPVQPDSCFVHVPCTYHANVLTMKPGDRFSGVVKQTSPLGLIFSASGHEVDFLVYKDPIRPLRSTHTDTALAIDPRPIPDSLWRQGAFATLVFEGVSAVDGPYASIDPAFTDSQPVAQPPDVMMSDARELLFELDSMLSGGGSSKSSPATGTVKKRTKKTAAVLV